MHEIVERCCSKTLAPNSPNFFFFIIKKSCNPRKRLRGKEESYPSMNQKHV